MVGHGLTTPSHRWMRSMLTGLGDRLAAVAAPEPAPVWLPGGVTHTDLTTDFAGDPGSPGDPVRGLLEEAAGDPAVGPTLFHFLNKALPYAGVWEAAGKPLFVHVHGYDVTWDMRPHDANRPPTHPADYIERVLAAPPCLRFVANSEETRGRLLKIGVSDSRIVVKPLGVPIGARPAPKPAGGPVKFLFVGRLVDCKGPDLTVEAFADAVGQGLDGELTVAGAGPLAVTCRLIAERRGVADRVRFPGSVDITTSLKLWAGADVFTAHSRRGPLSNQTEAYGVVFAEALAAGLPVVTGRSGGVPEVVAEGTGVLFEPGDVAAHAAALLKLGTDRELRLDMAAAAWRHAKKHLGRGRENRRLRELLGLTGGAGSDAPAAPLRRAA